MIIKSKKTILSLVFSVAMASTSLAAIDDKVYATVNGDDITQQDVSQILRDQKVNFESLPENQQKQVINGLIEQKLLANDAYKSDIPNSKEYKTELEKFKKSLAFQIWMLKSKENITVSEDEIKVFYDENKDKIKTPIELKASHILVKTQKEADDIIKQLSTSMNLKDDFTKLAQSKSTGPSGANGGELGWFKQEQMVPAFSTATLKLEKGTITKTAVKTRFGFHIIYLDDKKEPVAIPFEDVKDRLRPSLIEKKFVENVKKKADALKKNAKIEYK